MNPKVVSITIVFLFILMTFSSGIASLVNEEEVVLIDSMSVLSTGQEEQESTWEFRQLPNVTTIHDNGNGDPWSKARVQVMQSLVKEGDGIYFTLWIYATEAGRDVGDVGLQLGEIYVDGRSGDAVVLAKLAIDGEWKWARYLGSSPTVVYQMIEWSDEEIALIGADGDDNTLTIIDADNQTNYELQPNDKYIRYITSNNYDHYFYKYIYSDRPNGPFGVDSCSTETEDHVTHTVVFRLNSEMESEYVFGHTGWFDSIPDVYDKGITFSIKVHDSIEILPNEDCSEAFQVSPTNEFDGHFRENSSNTPPYLVLLYHFNEDSLIPLMFGPLCHWDGYFTSAGVMGSFYSPKIEVDYPNIFCVAIGAYQPINEQWETQSNYFPRDYVEEGNAIFEYQFETGISVSGAVDLYSRYIRRNTDYIGDMTNFYHEASGEITSWSPINGMNHPNLTFSPEIITSSNYIGEEWTFLCSQMTNSDCESGVFFTGAYIDFIDRGSPSDHPRNNQRGGIYQNPYNNNALYSNESLLNYHGGSPYIYDPIKSVEGVLIPDEEQHAILIVRGALKDILKPFERIGYDTSPSDDDADGIVNSADLCPSTPVGESVNEQGCSNSEIDSDSDGVVDSIDSCPNTPFNTDVDQNGCSDSQNVDESSIDGDTSNNNDASCQVIIDQNLAVTRTCAIPQGDLDWDGLPDEPTNGFTTDEDRDGDGKLDSIELSDSAVGNDPDSIDYGIIMSPDLDFVHGLTATLNENEIELNVEYRMTISEMMFVLSLVAYSNEDGTPVDPQDYDLNLNSAKELNRLEQEMCKSPNTTVTDDELTIPRWLENFSIEGQNSPLSWECEWVERRSVNLMDFMMISDASEIANWKDTVRYTLVLNDPTSDKTEVNVPLSNGTAGKVWELELKIPTGEQSMMYHPWAETGSFIITNPLGNQNTQGDETQTTTPQITPTYTSAWSIIIDVKEGSVDCSGYSDTVNEATSWEDFENIYQQNDIDYSSLNGYHEYSNSDDNINLVCSGNVGFQEYSEENKKDDFCAYLFLYGDLKLSKCDSGYASMVSLMGEKTTFEEELDNLFNTDDVSDSSDFGSEIEEMLDSLLLGMAVIVLVLATIIAIAKQQQKLKEKRDSEDEMNEYESFTNQFHTNPKEIESESDENSGDNDESNDIEEPDQDPEHEAQAEEISELENHRSPSFDFQGEINDDGWEICEYPRSSGVWWWKDYESESWILWD